MFYKVQPTLSGAVATGATITIRDVDAYRFKDNAPHTLAIGGVLYKAPTDFTVAVDGGNVATLTWLAGATLPSGGKPYIALGMYDTLTDAGGAGGGSGSVSSPIVSRAPGTLYTDVSVASLSAGQAAGTSTIIAANANRKSLMVNPPADCFLAISSGATAGWPLFAGVPNIITGQECPTNALYVDGLTAATALTVWEG